MKIEKWRIHMHLICSFFYLLREIITWARFTPFPPFLKRSEVIPSDLFFGIGQTYLDCAGVVEFFFCVRLCGDLLCFVCSGVAVFIDSIWLHWRISVVVCAWAVMLNIWGFLDGLWQCQSPNVSSFNLAWPGLFTKTDYLLPLVGLALSQW